MLHETLMIRAQQSARAGFNGPLRLYVHQVDAHDLVTRQRTLVSWRSSAEIPLRLDTCYTIVTVSVYPELDRKK